jgi:hypothetical protein
MALTAERGTLKKAKGPRSFPLAAGVKATKGGIAVLAAGYAKSGVTALNLIAAGMFIETVDNTNGAAGDKRADVEEGEFLFAIASADPVAQADVGSDVFIVDDETIAKTNGANTRSRAGKLTGIEGGQAWVKIGL